VAPTLQTRRGMKTLPRFLAFGSIALFSALAVMSETASAGNWPAGVTAVTASSTQTVSVKGNLKDGKIVDLGWASNSAVACFPATENDNFRGKHVFFGTQIPKQSVMKITAIPDDPTTDLSVYAYTVGSTSYDAIPPNVTSAVSCEAGYDAQHDHNPGASETVTLNAATNPYNVVIGVAGAKGVREGGFTLKVELTSGSTTTSATLTPTVIASESGKTVTVNGKLETGGIIDLAWASNSSVACFPATENLNFNGNHNVYRAALPKNSDMTITVEPVDPSTDVSLYAYTVSSTDTTSIPPNVTSAVSCEAGYDAQHDHNPGAAESVKLTAISNPYNVFIGVAGAGAAKAGSYKLKVQVAPR
jgi:hypothetical protein